MNQAPVIDTARLRLRAHRADDFDAIAAMAADAGVMRHISGPQQREDAWRRMLCGPGMWALIGMGYWVVERHDDQAVIGQVGIADFKRDMVPAIDGLPEAGWIFAAAAQGQGYAAEAVCAALAWADNRLGTREMVAVIDAENLPSIRLAERTGFTVREQAIYRGEPTLLFRRRLI